MEIKSCLYDNRSNCISIIVESTIEKYLNIAESSYKNKGIISGQRSKVTTKTAKTIRKRMIDDIKKGAILPPIVLGYIDESINENNGMRYDLQKILNDFNNISIIDGMQRTTAFMEAIDNSNEEEKLEIKKSKLRIEFWIAKNSNNLLYRMLVLNTGQLPWNLRRQVELVYTPLIKDINDKVPDIILKEQDELSKRTSPGEYPADKIIELYIAFGKKSNNIDTKEEVSEEFSRLDFIESTSNTSFNDYFFKSLSWLVQLDRQFGRFLAPGDKGSNKFVHGKDLFNSQPARIGFIVALSTFIMDYPGMPERTPEEQERYYNKLNSFFSNLIDVLNNKSADEIENFLDYATLDEKLNKTSSKIGAYERDVFTQAFNFLINKLRDRDLDNITLGPCWRAL